MRVTDDYIGDNTTVDYTLYESVCFQKGRADFKAWFLRYAPSFSPHVGLLGKRAGHADLHLFQEAQDHD